MRTWVPAWSDRIREADSALGSEVRKRIHCLHTVESAVLHLRKLHDYPRALRFRCSKCPHDLFIKYFGSDLDVSAEERALRLTIERRNLELLWSKKLFCASFSGPHLIGDLGSPHFAIIEEFLSADELLVLFRDVAQNRRGDDQDLRSAVSATASFLGALHETPLTESDRRTLPALSSWRDCASQRGFYVGDGNEVARLVSLQDKWSNDELLLHAAKKVCLIHGGLTSVNLLFSTGRQLNVVDFETLGLGIRYSDVGTFTAEIKTTFQLHAGEPWRAEPYISLFLEQYFATSKLDLTYHEFTRLQTFFMGQRLLLMSVGRSFDDYMGKWFARTALEVWECIERRATSSRVD